MGEFFLFFSPLLMTYLIFYFNSLVAVCDEGSKKGVDKGSTDFVDVNERYVTNGFFYISVEDADKQSSYMGKNL